MQRPWGGSELATLMEQAGWCSWNTGNGVGGGRGPGLQGLRGYDKGPGVHSENSRKPWEGSKQEGDGI